jgi:hypothetical protein
VFRLVEEALAIGAGVTVDAVDGDIAVAIEVESPSSDAVLALRARAESAGGSLVVTAPDGAVTALRARIPAR